MMEVIDKKEYLKKYISLGDNNEKKKKKRKHKVGMKTVKIIDDDIDLKKMRPIEEGEFDILLEGEDAPQIVGVVDERGPVDFLNKKRWKIISENEGDLTVTSTSVEKRNWDEDINAKQNKNNDEDLNLSRSKHSKNKNNDLSDNDLSPPRFKHSKDKRLDLSPHRQSKDDNSDLSPLRQSKNYDSDLSLPRQSRSNDSELSPPRQSRNYDSDLSPPRRSTKHRTSSSHGISGRSYRSSGNRDSDSDFSPPRKRKQNLDVDLYKSRKYKKSSNSDLNRSQRKEYRARRNDSPHSSWRKVDRGQHYSDGNSSRSSRQDISRSSKNKRDKEYWEDRDHKSPSYSDISEKRKKSRWGKEMDNSEYGRSKHSKDRRMTKTLDGKTAGLQDAVALREENEAYVQRQAELCNKLSKEVSGFGQAPIARDKTGRRRNFEAEAAEKREQEVRQREIDEKYVKWGKGLKQMEDHKEKLKNDLYEMNKPLARYADDVDLDKQLREQEREGDPMLKYIKEKQIREGKRKPDLPQYQGSYLPNRFEIKPGYRWDGVDRSNGYEKKWFEAQNEKVARQEEAYKWSTSDM